MKATTDTHATLRLLKTIKTASDLAHYYQMQKHCGTQIILAPIFINLQLKCMCIYCENADTILYLHYQL